MALTDENGSGLPATMLVGPTSVPYGGNNGGGMWGNDGSWIILLIIVLLAAGGGWGGFGANNGGAPIVINDGGNSGGAYVQRGFDQAAIMSGVGALQSGISALSMQLCGCCGDIQNTMNQGFAGVNMSINGAQNAIAQQLYTNQIADLERSYAAQTASTQGMTALQAQLAQCCCDNRLATNDLKYTIATENCADRAALSDGLRDVLTAQTANTQAILDKLCALELDGVKGQLAAAQRENIGLQNQLNMATMQASQVAQTAQIRAGQVAEIDAMYNRLRDCPVPTMPVYGMQPIFTCNNNGGCGCGGNSF